MAINAKFRGVIYFDLFFYAEKMKIIQINDFFYFRLF